MSWGIICSWNLLQAHHAITYFSLLSLRLFTKEEFEKCSKKRPLTSIEQNFETDSVKVVFHRGLTSKYINAEQNQIECCYQDITRSGANTTADDKYTLSKCQFFEDTFELPQGIEFILIQCKGSHTKDTDKKKAKTVYSNAHAVVRRKPQLAKMFDSFKTLYPSERPLSVLMIGIDSVSRLNLIRAMPNTAQHLYDTGWFELRGYNKVRSFPTNLKHQN